MLRRVAAVLTERPAAWCRRLPRRPLMTAPAPPGRHPRLEPRRGAAPPLARHPGGARPYARMARRIPPARPDGYSTSDGEADEPSSDLREREEDLAPRGGADGEEGDDEEGSEWEGFMLDLGGGADGDEEEEEEDGTEDAEK
ncbi:hypothetical protein ACP70R_035093 [Stipagrostis hirtigluma subsp. patula]